jgi:hypothetical protein
LENLKKYKDYSGQGTEGFDEGDSLILIRKKILRR